MLSKIPRLTNILKGTLLESNKAINRVDELIRRPNKILRKLENTGFNPKIATAPIKAQAKSRGGLPYISGEPNRRNKHDSDVDGANKVKPYSKSRPAYKKGQVEQVWENAKDQVTGKVYDPSGKEITWDKSKNRNGQWDMGHIPGEKYSEVHELYMNDIITKKEFLEWYRNPANYRPELPSTNRAHKFE